MILSSCIIIPSLKGTGILFIDTKDEEATQFISFDNSLWKNLYSTMYCAFLVHVF